MIQDLERARSSFTEAKKKSEYKLLLLLNAAAVLNVFIVIYFCCSCSLKCWDVPCPRERRD